MRIKELESQGYQFEVEGSFELIARRCWDNSGAFHRNGLRVIEGRRKTESFSEAIIKIKENDVEHTAVEGDGPVNADNALRKALIKFYPSLSKEAGRLK